jgi:Tfp pilus tip-associated adhesin PilY1
VVFITDGEESCGLNACDPDQAAWKIKLPDIGQPVKVFMIGFSEEFDPMNPSPLQCVSQITDGQFFAATNASQLSDALYDVINRMDEGDRSFVPFKVSPPPSSSGGTGTVNDYLALFPLFVPQQDESIWTGNLFAFKLNTQNPTLPVTGDCQIDLSLTAWDAATALDAQLSAPTPTRNVFLATDAASVWTRHDIEEVGTDATVRADFKDELGLPALPTDLETQEIVNFIRNIWDNPMALDPAPQNPPRPTGYSVLGDIFHSQPVAVNPPNNPMFFYDYGFVQPTEVGAHNYQLFMDEQGKRRRVALAGANDGMLHVFDAGFYDRDDGGTYDDQHDLGTGLELFAYVPRAVMDKLWVMTYGTEQQYLVDGQIAVSDVFISPDGGTSPREWRTVALTTMRTGGRGIVALDITQPDPNSGSQDYLPVESALPGCTSGAAGNCSAEYPRLMWEFMDESDADGNCPFGLSGDECAPFWDLGWTWSKPAIARIATACAVSGSSWNSTFRDSEYSIRVGSTGAASRPAPSPTEG